MPNVVRATQVAFHTHTNICVCVHVSLCMYTHDVLQNVCLYAYVCMCVRKHEERQTLATGPPHFSKCVCTATKKKRTCLAGEGVCMYVCMYMCPRMGWRRRMYVNVCMGHIWKELLQKDSDGTSLSAHPKEEFASSSQSSGARHSLGYARRYESFDHRCGPWERG